MLALSLDYLDLILSHARRDAPREACGLLAGRAENGVNRVARVFSCRNASRAPEVEYVVHPEDQLRALLTIEDELDLDLVGVYHSHPFGPAGPSSVDAARANMPEASYVIAWLEPGEGLGSWLWNGRSFEREEVQSA